MTDGESNSGMNLEQFRDFYRSLPDSVRGVRVFTVQFGDGNAEQLKAVAELTSGRFFDSKKTSLAVVFKGIRGYQ
jgi:Ca-activated chloride channel family protein